MVVTNSWQHEGGRDGTPSETGGSLSQEVQGVQRRSTALHGPPRTGTRTVGGGEDGTGTGDGRPTTVTVRLGERPTGT